MEFMLLAAVVALVVGAPVIWVLKRMEARQTIYEYAPETHRAKEGTPTMGGFIILVATGLAGIVLHLVERFPQSFADYWRLWFCVLLFALLGFFDDFLIRRLTGQRGLRWKTKLVGQFLIAGFAYWFVVINMSPEVIQAKPAPFLSWETLVGLVWIVGWINAFNLTDGLDGLAAGLSVIAFLFLGSLPPRVSDPEFLTICSGACLGYLWWNVHPAQVFMGDTGSMALGATFGLVTLREGLMTHNPLERFVIPLLIGLVFAVEILSVVIQLSWVKLFKRRLFKATPIHHHFEQLGWHEAEIVQRFWIGGILSGLVASQIFGWG